MDGKTFEVHIDYEAAKCEIDLGGRYGALELCYIWLEARDQIRLKTGKEPDEFMAGMRQLLEPA
jgi:hypothetical protein